MAWKSLRPAWLVILSFVVAFTSGCGSKNGPQRYQRKGKVTFDGKPVGKGEIIISPDRKKGGKGPGTTVTFEGGEYATRAGLGTLSGPHIVTVSGYDGKPVDTPPTVEPHPWGTMLFVRYRVEIDFPAEPSTHDFEVDRLPRQRN